MKETTVVGIIHECPCKDNKLVYAYRIAPSLIICLGMFTQIWSIKCIFYITEVHCSYNPATMIKDEGLLPTLLITVLFVSDDGTIHDNLGSLTSSLSLRGVGVSMHIYYIYYICYFYCQASSFFQMLSMTWPRPTKWPSNTWSETTIFTIGHEKNRVFVIYLILVTTT